MKVPVSWLMDFLDLPTRDPEELADILASLGHEVEGVEHITPTFEGVVVGRIERVGAHPDADKIRLCTVDDGSQLVQVVCGAWNFEAGAIIAYARVGSRLNLDSAQPFEVGVRELRGVLSHGMIASAKELGLGDDHEGILLLGELGAATEADLGRPVDEVIGIADVVLDVSITPNRGDCMSVRGVARELSAYWQIPLKDVDPHFTAGSQASDFKISVEDVEACPRFVGHEIDGVTIGPSPLWMQVRLMSVGQRPISNVVDVSNYVMLELGHPIHAFDADRIVDKQITARLAIEGEMLRTLDGNDRSLVAGDIVVADPSGPVALAGVMGGAATEVGDTTVNILVEAAHWRPASILRTSYRLGLRSEASARFERGVDPNLSDLAVARATQLIALTAGGLPRAAPVDAYPAPIRPWDISLSALDVRRLLGPTPDLTAACDLLRRLAFAVGTPVDDSVVVTVPTYRRDVTRPVDLVEEIARLHGFDRFPNTVPRGSAGALSATQSAMRHLRTVMVGAGVSEAQTLSFIGQSDLDALRLPQDDPRRTGIRVKNPLREEEGTMRTTLLPGLIAAAARNFGYGLKKARLFEMGRVFLKEPDPEDPRIPWQPHKLGFILLGGEADVLTGVALIELISSTTRLELTVAQAQLPALHPGRAGSVAAGDSPIGFVGELHPAVARQAGLEGRVVVAEIDLAPLVAERGDWEFSEVSVFPPHVFDLAFVVSDAVPAGDLMACIERAGGHHLEELELFDEYRDDSLPTDHRSLAVRLTMRAIDATLSDEDMAPLRLAIIEAVAKTLGATLRGST